MSDLRFDDVVIESQEMLGPEGTTWTAVCRACSKQHEATYDEMHSLFVTKEEMKFVAEMRAWNCCHEDDEPLNGFPDDPRKR